MIKAQDFTHGHRHTVGTKLVNSNFGPESEKSLRNYQIECL